MSHKDLNYVKLGDGQTVIWFKPNKLSLNLKKAKFMVFKPCQISIDNHNIVKVKATNFLGVILDENLLEVGNITRCK